MLRPPRTGEVICRNPAALEKAHDGDCDEQRKQASRFTEEHRPRREIVCAAADQMGTEQHGANPFAEIREQDKKHKNRPAGAQALGADEDPAQAVVGLLSESGFRSDKICRRRAQNRFSLTCGGRGCGRGLVLRLHGVSSLQRSDALSSFRMAYMGILRRWGRIGFRDIDAAAWNAKTALKMRPSPGPRGK